jgi:hypothetical protein
MKTVYLTHYTTVMNTVSKVIHSGVSSCKRGIL